MFDRDKLTNRLVELGEDWADKNAAADALEDATKAMQGKCFLDATGNVEERKAKALNDPEYESMAEKAREARTAATKARVRYDGMRTYIDLLRSQEATRREEARLGSVGT